MRLSRVNERRNNGSNPMLLIAIAAVVIIALLLGTYFIFGNGSEESSMPVVVESEKNQIQGSNAMSTMIPTPVKPTLVPTMPPTLVPTPAPTIIPTIIPTPIATPVPTLPPTPIPTLNVEKSPLPEVVNDNPPHVYVGTVTVDGQPAPEGTEVTAWMLKYSEALASSTVPAVADEPGSYSLLVPQYGTNFNGTVLMIKVNGRFVTNSVWMSGEGEILNLMP